MAKILVEHGARLKIQEKTGASQPTIRKALAGKTDTQLARLIRATAINEFGGTVQYQKEVVVK